VIGPAARAALLALVGAIALVGGGCGSTSGDQPNSRQEQRLAQDSLPSLTGERAFALRRLASGSEPTLLWFWAPWCEICNAEAPAIERLARNARPELRIVAIGGRDSIAAGRDFVDRHALRTPITVFDEPGRVWDAYGIGPQPAAVLLDPRGTERQRWYGPVSARALLDAARHPVPP
jgi:thiol-disulfide isomerase/thioredoxin